MSTVPPQDENAAATSNATGVLPDEAALKQQLLTHHVMLLDEARTALGDDAASLASKVVEGSFVRAWDARATILTADALEKFLIDDVHHAAARALSRRAGAHRLAHGAKEAHARPIDTTPDESWQHVLHALHGEEHSPSALTAMASASRHEAAGHIGGIAKSNKGTAAAMIFGLVAIAVVIGGMKMMNTMAAKGAVASALKSQDARPVTTPAGQAGNVSLADGSVARLAPESRLTLPKDFGPTLRGVKLEGAGSLEVAPNLEHDFELYAGNVVVISKGGSFVVSAYPADSSVAIVVTDGSVEVRQDKTTQIVQKDAGVMSVGGGALRAATAEERDVAAGWKSGMLVVTNRKLSDVLGLMKRWYGYDISVPDKALSVRPVTLRVSLDSAMQAVHQIEKSADMAFGYVGQNMVLRDGKGAKAKK